MAAFVKELPVIYVKVGMPPIQTGEESATVYNEAMIPGEIFKAYDIRGIYPAELNEDGAYRIAQAYAKFIAGQTVVLGRDVRLSGLALWAAAAKGLTDHGANVIDIGVVTTDMMYFAAATLECDGGIIVSASHNPAEYNGLKLVRRGAVPISGDTGIAEIKKLVQEGYAFRAPVGGQMREKNIRDAYLAKCLSFIDRKSLRSLRVVANGMFGPAVMNVQALELPLEIIPLNDQPDGSFPKGQPDPLQEKNRAETIELVQREKPDFGAAWDADADRFFLFDETGRFIPGYYLTAFLGEYFVKREPGAKVIYDPRLTWATIEKVSSAGGVPLANKAGHSFIKERMRREDAVFAGEMSGHYYFKDFFYADNGLIPFLLLCQIFSASPRKVSEVFDEYFAKYFISGEINFRLANQTIVQALFAELEEKYADAKIEKTDGLSFEYPDWRANIRASNTEPLLRLNVEARREDILVKKVAELSDLLRRI